MEILQITRKTSQKKTKRSLFAARRYLDVLKLPIHIINKLFNTLFFPILTYCSEVWGIYDKSDHQELFESIVINLTETRLAAVIFGFSTLSGTNPQI